jgi:heme/copper-type cytochrome/quinol oxidase subunit 2
VVVATIAVLVLAFILLSPEADDNSNTADTPTTTAPPVTTSRAPATTGTTATPPAPPAADHEPAYQRVLVRAGKPVGGIKKITVRKGQRARIEVTSPDTSDEIHLHGYDIARDLKAGGRVRFAFDADAEGIFEIELEGAGTQIAQLTVEP